MADAAATVHVDLPSGDQAVVTQSTGLNNWKTLAWAFAVAVIPTAYDWFTKVDWTQYVSPTHALWIVAGGTIFFRILTKGPIFSSLTVTKK